MPSFNNDNFYRDKNIEKGRSYEKRAALFFKQNGYEIIEQNWRVGHKEIDLIVKKGNLLVFVEVKSSSSKKFGHPSEHVDAKKIANLTQAAQQYIIAHDIKGVDFRFDVVTFLDGRLEYYPNAFEASP
ncbi:MAG: YraN family protein [FCB group bacterium]|nr:YraN family protein [FCB group bacterium]